MGALLIFTAPAVAAVVWPTNNSNWTAITQGTGTPNGYVDSVDSNQDTNLDVVGSKSLSAGYYVLDDAQNLLMFRIRISKTPYQSGTTWAKNVWQVLLETDGTASTIEWALQVDMNTAGASNRVEFGAVTHASNDTWVKLAVTDSTWNSSTLFRTVATGETAFGSAADYFIDMAIPYKVFSTYTGIGIGDTFSVGLSTSAQHNNVNKDTPDSLGPSGGPFSNSITFDVAAIPEPSTAFLMAVGLLVLYVVKRRRDRLRKLRPRTAAARSHPPPSGTASR